MFQLVISKGRCNLIPALYEYALAVKAQANRNKDWIHIAAAMESYEPDKDKLQGLLQKYNLLSKWRRKIEDE